MNQNTEQQFILVADDPKPGRFTGGKPSECARYGSIMENWYDRRFIYDRQNQTITLCFLYAYEVDLDRINNPEDLLSWVTHLCGKRLDGCHLNCLP
jgi:hypothetical protein